MLRSLSVPIVTVLAALCLAVFVEPRVTFYLLDWVRTVTFSTVLAGILALPHLYRVGSFIWLYFLRPSSVQTFRHGQSPYALVTGATDGIGKAVSAELMREGFNLILHGRNETKMLKVVEDLRSLVPERPDVDIRYFIADAEQSGHDFEKMIAPFKDLHITLVFHNVGGSEILPERIDERTEEHILAVINRNAFFSLFLTRVLLPPLRRAAASGPVLVQYSGSLAGDISPPRLAIYAATKGFLQSLVRGLDNDELHFDKPSGVRFAYLDVGSVYSGNHEVPLPTGIRTPSCEVFAKAVLARTGCGRRRVTPYVVHAAVQGMIGMMGQRLTDKFSAEEMWDLLQRGGRV